MSIAKLVGSQTEKSVMYLDKWVNGKPVSERELQNCSGQAVMECASLIETCVKIAAVVAAGLITLAWGLGHTGLFLPGAFCVLGAAVIALLAIDVTKVIMTFSKVHKEDGSSEADKTADERRNRLAEKTTILKYAPSLLLTVKPIATSRRHHTVSSESSAAPVQEMSAVPVSQTVAPGSSDFSSKQ